MAYKEIHFETKGAIAYLTLNRPDIRNAITDETIINEIVDVCQFVQNQKDVCALIVTGAGSAFSAGGNVKDMHAKQGMFSGNPEQLRENYRQGIQRIPLALYYLDVPTIAAVNGPAIGAGCDLACMCDIRIASEKARFGETFVSPGLESLADNGIHAGFFGRRFDPRRRRCLFSATYHRILQSLRASLYLQNHRCR